jgi:hypothetical protein
MPNSEDIVERLNKSACIQNGHCFTTYVVDKRVCEWATWQKTLKSDHDLSFWVKYCNSQNNLLCSVGFFYMPALCQINEGDEGDTSAERLLTISEGPLTNRRRIYENDDNNGQSISRKTTRFVLGPLFHTILCSNRSDPVHSASLSKKGCY